MHRRRSPSFSPAPKRQRLSSPTYEDQFSALTQEDLAAFDEIEARVSQGNLSPSNKKPDSGYHSRLSSQESRLPSSQAEPTSSFTGPRTNNTMLVEDSDNPFRAGFSLASKIPVAETTNLKASAAAVPSTSGFGLSPSSEVPPADHNYDDWFKPAPMDMSTDFGIPSFKKASFKGLGKASLIMPSEDSIAKAKARQAAWDMEDSILEGKRDVSDSSPSKHVQNAGLPSFKIASHLKEKRPVLAALPNALNAPDVPHSSLLTPTAAAGPSKMKAAPFSHRHSGFKSPLQASTAAGLPGSPLNHGFTTLSAPGNPHPLSSTPITAARLMQNAPDADIMPSRLSTPVRSTRTRPAKFVTPFKRPGELGHLSLLHSGNSSSSASQRDTSTITVAHNSGAVRTTARKQFFSLTPPLGRKTLAISGLKPQQYDEKEYHSFGIDIVTLNQITPESALYYFFHGGDSSDGQQNLGPAEALKELQQKGCTLATKPWVDNHWCLILWKLAGMVALDPQQEGIPQQKRWCWSEVIHQLLYRYEREHNSGIRPPFQKIANQDVPSSHPMVLCVSNIFWLSAAMTDDGVPIEPHPELEVTDGWYRLKAQIDLPLARAVRKGVIRIGRKIGIVGARLSTERKEPSEILEAYSSTKLILSANSSHPVAWHSKLGFTRGPCISTLHKLDPDGGLIAALDLVIVKAHPVAFLEFVETTDGKKARLGPRNEAEERQVHEIWKKRRDVEASKLQEEYDKKFCRYEGYIERLEAKAGSLLHIAEDGPQDETENFFDELEYSAARVLSRVTPSQAAGLARRTQHHVEQGRQTTTEEIERELRENCPPREVRAFRVLIVQDSRTCRKPGNRTAQLTVWNIMSLTLDEGGRPGDFAVGQRYLVSNVVPTSLSAWMNREPGSEIFLSTRRDTRWIRIRA